MKTYLFVVPTIFRAGSVLRTDIFKRLASEPNTKVVVVSPFSNETWFKEEFPQATHVPLDTIPLNFVRRIMRWRDILLAIDKPFFIRARVIERSIVERRTLSSLSPKETFWRIVGLLARPFRFIVFPLFNLLEEQLLPTRAYRALISEYKPSGIILGTLSEPQDVVWLALSRIYRIPAFAVDLPWSYVETRFFAVPRRAHVMMWNEKMKKEFLALYPFPEELLHITGSQRYDFYAKKFPTMSREEFFGKLGLDPTKRLITYFVSSDFWHTHQSDVTKVLLEAIERGDLPRDSQLVVRLGWRQKIHEGYDELIKKYSNVFFQKAEELPHQDYPSHLIYYSDVSLSPSSSLTLDAAVMDKPKILTGLTGLPYKHSDEEGIKAIFEYEFLKQAIETGGIKVAYTTKELLSLMRTFIENPRTDADNRKKLVSLFLDTVDGNAGTRIAETILTTSN